jgi:hypothetical protein
LRLIEEVTQLDNNMPQTETYADVFGGDDAFQLDDFNLDLDSWDTDDNLVDTVNQEEEEELVAVHRVMIHQMSHHLHLHCQMD